ncbi:hypothetical protein [Gulosibacter chungangensis]|uniref:hypothetical protein n=1 Tax=Gulosibacter chungangensis TaxID=979746 RepID=UPI001CE41EE2|nr:hypothetical protein [Gulosibacter chungangensis]
MRVDRRAGRCVPLIRAEQVAQLVALAVPLRLGVVEDLGDRTPRRPAGQCLPFISGGGPLLLGQRADDLDRGEVGAEPRFCSGRGEVVLRRRDEPRQLSRDRFLRG